MVSVSQSSVRKGHWCMMVGEVSLHNDSHVGGGECKSVFSDKGPLMYDGE